MSAGFYKGAGKPKLTDRGTNFFTTRVAAGVQEQVSTVCEVEMKLF